MPSLKDMLAVKSLPGYAAQNPSTPPATNTGGLMGQNPYRRCPLPPFSAGPDTLRQFDESGKIPAHRVIPLPAASASTGNSTSITEVSDTASSSSGGSGGGSGGGSTPTPTPTLTAATVTLNIPALAPGQVFLSNVKLAKSYQLLLVSATQPVEVRLYSTKLAQVSDQIRPTGVPVPFEVTSGIITDVVFDTLPYLWNWQNRIGANSDSPQTTNGYITLINPQSGGLSSGTVTIRFLPLET